MMNQTKEGFDQALAIIHDRGDHLNRQDMAQIETLIDGLPIELVSWVYEALFLVVNAPEYDGDIPAIQ